MQDDTGDRIDMIFRIQQESTQFIHRSDLTDFKSSCIVCVVRLGTLAGAVEVYPQLSEYWNVRLHGHETL